MAVPHNETIPTFLLTVYAKGDKDSLSKAERNTLRSVTGTLIKTYEGKTS